MDNSDQLREATVLFAEAKEFITALRKSSLVRRIYSAIILLVISLMAIMPLCADHRTGHHPIFSVTTILSSPVLYAICVGFYVLFSIGQLFLLYQMDRHQYYVEREGADPRSVVNGIIDAYALAIERSSANHRRHYQQICRDLIVLLLVFMISIISVFSGLSCGIL